MDFDFHKYSDLTISFIVEKGPSFLLAILVMIVGLKVITFIHKLLNKAFEKSNVDATLRPFLESMITWALKVLLFISVASMVGIETTSFIAVLGAAGLAVGMALQGTLANFAGGVLILMLKPYKIGDLINTQGEFGEVEEIGIFNTIIVTPENKSVIIPNGAIMNGNITNVTRKNVLRVDLTVGISYDADIKLAKEVLTKVMVDDEQVLQEPAPLVAVAELADSSINLVVRPYCTPENYWDVRFRVLENCKLALDNANINIPFPQMDVHLDK